MTSAGAVERIDWLHFDVPVPARCRRRRVRRVTDASRGRRSRWRSFGIGRMVPAIDAGRTVAKERSAPIAGMMPPAVSERPTRIVVDLDHLAFNLRSIRAHVGVPVMGIVKANAYGHGLVPVALHLQAQGVEQLGVAFVEEGIALRQAGVTVADPGAGRHLRSAGGAVHRPRPGDHRLLARQAAPGGSRGAGAGPQGGRST